MSEIRLASNASYRVAVVEWEKGDETAEAIGETLSRLGHQPTFFSCDSQVPVDVDVVLTFGPHGDWLQIPQALESISRGRRPLLVHWNFEGIPNPRLPWFFGGFVSFWRSWLGRYRNSDTRWSHFLFRRFPLHLLTSRMYRFRYVGDYYYAYRKGLLDLFLEASEIYADYYRRHELPAIVVPWGTPASWHADLALERDIDVVWMGKRRTKRRSRLLDQVRQELSARGVEMYVVDNVEKPFVFGDERTRLLNRAKVTLNLLPTWWDNAFPFRFNIAAGNRSLVVSEPVMPHCRLYEAGKHYVSAPPEKIAETIVFYLTHEDERREIAENAYRLVTTDLTLENSIRHVMELVAQNSGCPEYRTG